MTKHEETAKRLIEKIYKDAGYHPQVDNFINAVAAALARADAEIAQFKAACNAYSEQEILDGDLRAQIGKLKENVEIDAAMKDNLRARLAEAERERDESHLRINTLLEDISRAIAERDAAEAKGVRMGLERAREIFAHELRPWQEIDAEIAKAGKEKAPA